MKKQTKIWHPEKSVHLDFTVGEGTTIHALTWIGNGVTIGERCFIEAFVFIPEWVTIEDDVFIGPHVCFTNDKKPPSFGKHWAKTLVKKGASIGAGAVILPGVTIGEKAMIGAGAVVVDDVKDGETVIPEKARRLVRKVARHYEEP